MDCGSDWNNSNLRAIAVMLNGAPSRNSGAGDLLVVFNADEVPFELNVPPPDGAEWTVVFDTSLADPAAAQRAVPAGERVRIEPRSTMLLESAPR